MLNIEKKNNRYFVICEMIGDLKSFKTNFFANRYLKEMNKAGF